MIKLTNAQLKQANDAMHIIAERQLAVTSALKIRSYIRTMAGPLTDLATEEQEAQKKFVARNEKGEEIWIDRERNLVRMMPEFFQRRDELMLAEIELPIEPLSSSELGDAPIAPIALVNLGPLLAEN